MFDIDKPLITNDEKRMLLKCVGEGCLSQGKYVFKFEEKFSAYCGTRYACAASNGTAALHLALAALGIGPGDEVLVPTLTFIATVTPVTFCGAAPVFVDCDPKTWCIDVEDMAGKITKRAKAVVPVHLYGNACEMDGIRRIAGRHNLKIVEDCAEAHGTLYKGRKVGSFSDISFYSFYKNKHITTGEGGICLTDDAGLCERMKLLRSHGKERVEDLSDADFAEKQFISRMIGFNYRMTDMQAAVGLAQLEKIDRVISKRISYARLYMKLLEDLDITFPFYDEAAVRHTYWGLPVLFRTRALKVKVMLAFKSRGIRLRPFFNPNHLQPFYKSSVSCPVAEDAAARGVVLPNIHTMREGDVRTVAKLVRDLAA